MQPVRATWPSPTKACSPPNLTLATHLCNNWLCPSAQCSQQPIPPSTQHHHSRNSCETPNGLATTRHLTANQIYHLFGNQKFWSYKAFHLTAKDSTFGDSSDPVHSLDEFATIPKCTKGKPLPPPLSAIHHIHLDIAFGDGLGQLGIQYILILVNHAKWYIWVIGLKNLHSYTIHWRPQTILCQRWGARCLVLHWLWFLSFATTDQTLPLHLLTASHPMVLSSSAGKHCGNGLSLPIQEADALCLLIFSHSTSWMNCIPDSW